MKAFINPSKKLLEIRGRQRLLSLDEVRAQMVRHKAARLAAQSGSGSSNSSINGLPRQAD